MYSDFLNQEEGMFKYCFLNLSFFLLLLLFVFGTLSVSL